MDSLEFIGIIATFALILIWYLQNEAAGREGTLGLLGILEDAKAESRPDQRRSYRVKPRLIRRRHQPVESEINGQDETPKPAFRVTTEKDRMRRRFRQQDEARYRVKDKVSLHRSLAN